MIAILFTALALASDVQLPQVLDGRLQVQLVAAEPEVVTPTGIAVDAKGRVLVIESHTHFRPDGYQGPPADRILLMEDFDPASGKARKISVFYEGTKHTMNLALYHDGAIYVATRMEIFRLRDKDGDGKADERTPICHLETPGNYPHNGLSGLAFDFAGNIYFGFGENLGAEYKLIGSDSRTLTGGGEGGNIYCCDAEGKNLRRVATGFWNPFGMCFDAFGRLFAVDNDPDSRPPCRLLYIVEGGDYGFRFRNGRKGVHPFTAWNGELPGTLPMVCGTGEAPSAVLAYESDNLPEEYRGDLFVTSWGDHRLERYRLRPRGASFSGEMTPILRGNQNFRPVGLALAPDGSLFISDWVDKSYPLHGKGRVWRLSAKNPPKRIEPKDDWEALASADRSIREGAYRNLSVARPLNRERVAGLLFASHSEQIQLLAAKLLANDDDYISRAMLISVAGSHPSANVRAGLTKHLANWPVPSSVRERTPQWSAEGLTLLLMNKETRPYAWAQIPAVALAPMQSRTRPAAPSADRAGVKASPDLRGRNFWAAVNEDPFLLHAVSVSTEIDLSIARQARRRTNDEFAALDSPIVEQRLAVALAAKRCGFVAPRELVSELLADPDPRLRIVGLLWTAEARPTDIDRIEWRVENALQRTAITKQLFEVTLATLDALQGARRDPRNEPKGDDFALKVLFDKESAREVRRLALRSTEETHPALTMERLSQLMAEGHIDLRVEAIRTLRQRPEAAWWPPLREIAANSDFAPEVRCEAILSLSPDNTTDRRLLDQLTKDSTAEVAEEARRALRPSELSESDRQALPKQDDLSAWLARADGTGDPEVGERIFFHNKIAGCFRCHEFEGRGHTVGPDLSTIGRSMTRERLVQSIIDPGREIAPQFTSHSMRLNSGEVLTGLHVGDEVDGRMRFADQSGRLFHVHSNDIDQRQPSTQSIMPKGLAENLTAQELRDLIAFLLRK